jgi:predicted Zn-dependent protease with MMP-like domain
MPPSKVDRLLEQALAEEDPSAAAALLEKARALDPEDPDVLYELGLAKEELGDREGMIAAFVEVSRLDPLSDRAAGLLDDRARDRIASSAEDALERIPEPFRSRLGNVAEVIEDYPPRHVVEQGFDPRAYGMFEGPDDLAQHLASEILVTPTCIVLFAANLLAAFPPEEIEEQVTVTVLHEIGHYFGLDEDEVAALGLA